MGEESNNKNRVQFENDRTSDSQNDSSGNQVAALRDNVNVSKSIHPLLLGCIDYSTTTPNIAHIHTHRDRDREGASNAKHNICVYIEHSPQFVELFTSRFPLAMPCRIPFCIALRLSVKQLDIQWLQIDESDVLNHLNDLFRRFNGISIL